MPASINFLLFSVASIYSISAQIAGPGKCPPIESMKGFNMDKFLGKWYEVAKFFTLFEIKCSEANYIKDNDNQIKVVNKGIERVPSPETFMPSLETKDKIPFQTPQKSFPANPTLKSNSGASRRRRRRENESSTSPASDSKGNLPKNLVMGQYPIKELPKIQLIDVPTEAIATIIIPEASEPGKFVLNFTRGPQADFKIVDTDYQTFAIIWSCHDMFEGNFNAQFSSILSRQRTIDNDVLEKAKKKMSSYGVDIQRFELSDQKNCPDEIKIPPQNKKINIP